MIQILAQAAPDAVTTEAITPAFEQLGSMSGIIVATGVAVQVLKKTLGDTAAYKAVPTWLLATVVSVILVAFANQVVGVLQGNFVDLAWTAVLTAGGASGFYTWVNGKAGTGGTKANMLLIPLTLCMVTGCSQSMSQQYATYSDTYSVTLKSLATMAKLDKLNDKDIAKIDSTRLEINSLLDEMEKAVKADDGTKFNTLSKKINLLLTILETHLTKKGVLYEYPDRDYYIRSANVGSRYRSRTYSIRGYAREQRFNGYGIRASNCEKERSKYSLGGRDKLRVA